MVFHGDWCRVMHGDLISSILALILQVYCPFDDTDDDTNMQTCDDNMQDEFDDSDFDNFGGAGMYQYCLASFNLSVH